MIKDINIINVNDVEDGKISTNYFLFDNFNDIYQDFDELNEDFIDKFILPTLKEELVCVDLSNLDDTHQCEQIILGIKENFLNKIINTKKIKKEKIILDFQNYMN